MEINARLHSDHVDRALFPMNTCVSIICHRQLPGGISINHPNPGLGSYLERDINFFRHNFVTSVSVVLDGLLHAQASACCANGFSISSLPSTGLMTTNNVPRATTRPSGRVASLPSPSTHDAC